jgi:Ni,Fe-hydrogenase I small subunit
MEGEMKKKGIPEIVSADDGVPINKYVAKAINQLKNKSVMTMCGDIPVNFSSDNTIVAYRLETAITDMLRSTADKLKVTICWADCVSDLIAVPAFMNIVNPSDLTEAETDEIFRAPYVFFSHQCRRLKYPQKS